VSAPADARPQPVKGDSAMRHPLTVALALAVTLVAGCGGGGGDAGGSASNTPPAPAAKAATTLPPDLDAGPRAAATDADEAQAEAGESLFQSKGCSACHAFGSRATGPDLAGVSTRRTARWIESQILHPEVMVKEDPIARGLFAQFALQMPNQKLTEAEARSIVEYFKHRDAEAAEKD
jgi:cytochrome c